LFARENEGGHKADSPVQPQGTVRVSGASYRYIPADSANFAGQPGLFQSLAADATAAALRFPFFFGQPAGVFPADRLALANCPPDLL
jgi:hypothetical protein